MSVKQSGDRLLMPSSAKLIVLEGPSPGEEIEITQPEMVVGRDASSDLVIASPMVSRRHARLFQSEDGYWIEDLGSSNKTYLNGQPLTSPQRLHSGDAHPARKRHPPFLCPIN